MISEKSNYMEEWGYAFLENGFCAGRKNGSHHGGNGQHSSNGGCGCDHNQHGHRLWFTLREKPTREHFDPVSARVWQVSPQAGLERRILRHPVNFYDELSIGPGHVQLRDRYGRNVDAFTFGGKLTTEYHHDFTSCTLHSPAPIFDLRHPETFSASTVFCERVEGLLAQRKASWIIDPPIFTRRLADADPFDLYRSCLKSLITGPISQRKASSQEAAFTGTLLSEVHRLESNGLWNGQVQNIEALV